MSFSVNCQCSIFGKQSPQTTKREYIAPSFTVRRQRSISVTQSPLTTIKKKIAPSFSVTPLSMYCNLCIISRNVDTNKSNLPVIWPI